MRRLSCIILGMCLLLSVLSACGGTSAAGAQSAQSEPDVPESAQIAEPETTVPPEMPEPETVDSALDAPEDSAEEPEPEPIEVSYPLTDEPAEMTMWSEQPNLGPLRMWGGDYGVDLFEDYTSIQHCNELTNVYVSFENASMENAATLFNLHVASGDWADMICGADLYYAGGSNKAYSDSVLIDLAKLLPEYAPHYQAMLDSDPNLNRIASTDDGAVIEFCATVASFMQSEGSIIRKDWLDKVGMDVPDTLDELYEVIKAFQSEIGCDYPFYFNSACNQLLTSYNLKFYVSLSSNDLAIYQIDGKVMSNYTSDVYRDWLENMHKWYAEGLIDPDFISVSSSMFGGHDEQLLAADNIGVWWGNINSMTNYYSICPAEGFDIVPTFIFATDERANHSTATTAGFRSGTGISANCDQPELAAGWLDYWYSEEGIVAANYGLEGESYEIVDGEIQYTDVIMNSSFGIDPAVALKLYAIAGCGFGVQRDERTFPFYIECQKEATSVWTDPCDGLWAYPGTTLTTEESDTIATYGPDVCTYVAENVPRFIMGEKDVDADWDEFVSTVRSLGMDRCLDAYQSALDRYLNA